MRTDLPYTVIRLIPDVCYVPGHAPIVTLKSDVNIRLASTFKRFGVGAVPVGNKAFNERGIEQPGPWAFAFGLATVIDNNPERRQAEHDRDVIVNEGDLLMIDAKCYRVEVLRGEFINLRPVETPALPVRAARFAIVNREAKHRYAITVTRDILGNQPYVDGKQVDRVDCEVDANTRTQAAALLKRTCGWRADDVNMIG